MQLETQTIDIQRKVTSKPLVTIIAPAYNEESIIEENLLEICHYMQKLEDSYQWELLIINDGSQDDTAHLAEKFAKQWPQTRVLHHTINFGLGQALKYAFSESRGDYVITMDIDLSFATEHIERLLKKITETHAKIVIASPYMKGGTIANVPFFRRILSIVANKFLSIMSRGHFSSVTGMVRAYNGIFIRSLDLRATGMNIMPEIIYKAMINQAHIEQVPGHLDWGKLVALGDARQSSMRVFRQIMATLLAGFLFRPVIIFILPGLLLLLFSAYVNVWMFIHFIEALPQTTGTSMIEHATQALALSYKLFPHTYLIGILSLMLSIQLIGLGIQSLQSKSYFEELFHIASRIVRLENQRNNKNEDT